MQRSRKLADVAAAGAEGQARLIRMYGYIREHYPDDAARADQAMTSDLWVHGGVVNWLVAAQGEHGDALDAALADAEGLS